MSFYNKPWAPGYALPPYLADEDPLERGSGRTTAQLPGGTFGPVPKNLKFGDYVVPQYVKDEPIGSHARTTPWLADGTIAPMPSSVKDSGNPWSDNTLQSNGLGSLGDPTLSEPTLPGGDPIKEYGHQAAAIVLEAVNNLPPKERGEGLRQLLNEVDPKLNAALAREAAAARNAGDKDPLRAGLAAAFSRGMLDEFIRLGKKKKLPKKSQVGLGATWAQHNNYVGTGLAAESQALGGVWSTLKSWAGSAVDKLGSAACTVAGNSATPLVAGAAGAYYGGPTGASLAMTGAGMAAAACAPDPEPGAGGGAFIPGFSGAPGWALPAVIGGGALALILILKK
jgi:hypothetical protein